MDEIKIWCKACGMDFPNECTFWTHFCDCMKTEICSEIEDTEEWKERKRKFITYKDPFLVKGGDLVLDNDH